MRKWVPVWEDLDGEGGADRWRRCKVNVKGKSRRVGIPARAPERAQGLWIGFSHSAVLKTTRKRKASGEEIPITGQPLKWIKTAKCSRCGSTWSSPHQRGCCK